VSVTVFVTILSAIKDAISICLGRPAGEAIGERQCEDNLRRL
jgi:hypothetical protein